MTWIFTYTHSRKIYLFENFIKGNDISYEK